MKNWIGNSNSVYKTLGASNHSKSSREQHDYYATEPKALELLLDLESFQNVLEPACGEGHLSKVFVNREINIVSSGIINRGYGIVKDFFHYQSWNGDIVTNPPYRYAKEFVEHALNIISNDSKVAMFLKLQFLESKKRKQLFTKTPPKIVYVSSNRFLCAKNGDFEKHENGSAVAYAWFIGKKGFTGQSTIKWFN